MTGLIFLIISWAFALIAAASYEPGQPGSGLAALRRILAAAAFGTAVILAFVWAGDIASVLERNVPARLFLVGIPALISASVLLRALAVPAWGAYAGAALVTGALVATAATFGAGEPDHWSDPGPIPMGALDLPHGVDRASPAVPVPLTMEDGAPIAWRNGRKDTWDWPEDTVTRLSLDSLSGSLIWNAGNEVLVLSPGPARTDFGSSRASHLYRIDQANGEVESVTVLPIEPWLFKRRDDPWDGCFSCGCSCYREVTFKAVGARLFARPHGREMEFDLAGIWAIDLDEANPRWVNVVHGAVADFRLSAPNGCVLAAWRGEVVRGRICVGASGPFMPAAQPARSGAFQR